MGLIFVNKLFLLLHCFLQVSDEESESLAAFFRKNSYLRGTYDDISSFARLNAHLSSLPGGEDAKRLFYLALPPTVYHHVSTNIRAKCMSSRSAATSPKTPAPPPPNVSCACDSFNLTLCVGKAEGGTGSLLRNRLAGTSRARTSCRLICPPCSKRISSTA